MKQACQGGTAAGIHRRPALARNAAAEAAARGDPSAGDAGVFGLNLARFREAIRPLSCRSPHGREVLQVPAGVRSVRQLGSAASSAAAVAYSESVFHPMTDHARERIALFIDGANLHSASRGLGFSIDFKRLLEHFGAQGRLVRALLLHRAGRRGGILSPPTAGPTGSITTATRWSPSAPRSSTDAYGNRRVKGDMDVEIAIDAMEMAGKLDRIVLFSGDGDFPAAGGGGSARGGSGERGVPRCGRIRRR